MTEQLYLFEDITPTPSSNEDYRQSSIFEDYDGFVEKFKPKKTTDDCYTPPAVYDVVRGWVMKQWPELEGATVVRPFYPGGDFEHFDYPAGCVVIDNPPFSIYAKIVRWYVAHGIRFFLFGPHLTLPITGLDLTYIVADADITYENGAVVRTGFVTNLPSEFRIVCAPQLRRDIRNACKTIAPPPKKTTLPQEPCYDCTVGENRRLYRLLPQEKRMQGNTQNQRAGHFRFGLSRI